MHPNYTGLSYAEFKYLLIFKKYMFLVNCVRSSCIICEEISTLVNEFKPAGTYEGEFNAAGLASGVYIYRMKVNDFSTSKKMILLR